MSMVNKAAGKLNNDGIQMYSEPRFKPLVNLNRNSPFSFSMVFDIIPKVVKNIDIDSAIVEFEEYYYDDKMVEYTIQKEFKSLNTVTGKIEPEDMVSVKILNNDFPGDNNKTFDSSIVKPLTSHKTGEKLKLSFSDLNTYIADFLGIIKDELEIEIVKIERPSMQEVTDDLVQQVSVFKTVAEYKNSTKLKVENMEREFNNMSKKNALIAYISKNAKVEFSKSEYIRNSKNEVLKFIENNYYVSEIPLSNLLEDKKIKDDFDQLPYKIYENIVFYIAVKDIASNNSIQQEQGYIDKIALSYAEEKGLSLEEYKQKTSKEEWDSILEMAMFESAIDWLLGKVKFKVKSKLPLIKVK